MYRIYLSFPFLFIRTIVFNFKKIQNDTHSMNKNSCDRNMHACKCAECVGTVCVCVCVGQQIKLKGKK